MKTFKILEKIGCGIIGALFGTILLYLTLLSIISTSAIDADEHTYFLADHPLMHLAVLTIVVIFFILFRLLFPNKKLSGRFVFIILLLILMLELIWVLVTRLAPYADQKLVLESATQMSQHDFSSFQKEGYAYNYKHQHGIILFYYLLTFVFGKSNYVGMQILNIAALAGIFLGLFRLSLLIFQKKPSAILTMLAAILYFPLSFYVTFVYGNLFGLAMALWAIYFELRWFQEKKIRFLFLSTFLILFSIVLKQNNLIILIAMLLLAGTIFLFERQLRTFLLILFMSVTYLLGNAALDHAVTAVTGEKVVEGVPMMAYLAMGFQEAAMAPGWYNDYNRTLYVKLDYDSKATATAAKENLEESLQTFAADPSYALQFFSKKLASEWNNPTFQCFWIQENRQTSLHLPDWVTTIMKGSSDSFLVRYLNLLHTVILFGALSYIVLDFKNLRMRQYIFAIIFIGGFFFHIFWEAKAQYTLPYFVLLLPYGVQGFLLLSERIVSLVPRRHSSRKKLPLRTALFRNGVIAYFAIFLLLLLICTKSSSPFLQTTFQLQGDEAAYETYLEKYTPTGQEN